MQRMKFKFKGNTPEAKLGETEIIMDRLMNMPKAVAPPANSQDSLLCSHKANPTTGEAVFNHMLFKSFLKKVLITYTVIDNAVIPVFVCSITRANVTTSIILQATAGTDLETEEAPATVNDTSVAQNIDVAVEDKDIIKIVISEGAENVTDVYCSALCDFNERRANKHM